ncbi:TonB-dependent receptor plug domain-containing protein [Phenylobacterium sp.]|uniref:TonB-dependent receptor plug domain-containing protein n=1 Tax=Phenylobacterium sp. TaxID=1871053 RepID=UPI0035AE7ACD
MSMNSSTRSRLLASSVLGAMLIAAPAVAQEAVEEIVVTGSRIARQDLTSVSPVATVGAEELAQSGVVNTENLINTLPQAVPGISSNVNNGNGGFSTVNLRGLGSIRTLVLVDGKRQTPTSQSGQVDINLIPPALIERLEVVSGGASAVYGSDAIAGVVNFILKRDFEGFEFRAGYSTTDEGDAPVYSADLTMGANIDGGRGNVVLSLGYNKREPMFQGDSPQDKLHISLGEPPATAANRALIFSGSGSEEFGRVGGFAPGRSVLGNAANTALFLTNGDVRLYAGAPDTYNFAPVNYLQTPQERYSVTAMGRYDITDTIEAFAKGNFVNSQVTTQLAPTPIGNRIFRFTLDNNPFLTAAAKQTLNSLGSTTPYTIAPGTAPYTAGTFTDVDTDGDGIFDTVTGTFNRRLTEVGPRISEFNFFGFQLQAGLRGKLDFVNGQWETFLQYGNTHGANSLLGDTSLARIQQGLLLNAAGTACQDPSNGCVPINLFGRGNISAAAANFISTRINSSQDYQQIVASGFVSGDTSNFFSLPAGGVGFALGAEYRSDEFDFRPSQDLATGNLTGFNASPPVSGYFDVYELYGEAVVPVLKDLPFVESLNLELAGRISDYSSQTKLAKTYKVAGDWQMFEDLRLRASYNRAVRAPSVGELFRPQSNSFPTATDPCSFQGPARTNAQVRAACIASGVPANLVGVIQANQQTQTLSGGNPDLEPEVADTYSAGLVYSPTFVPGLSVTVDYFDIRIKDLINSFGGSTANVMSVCYGPIVGGNPNSPYCQAITRLANGSIQNVSLLDLNVAKLETQGLDIAASYRFEVQDLGLPDLGSVGVRMLYTNTWKHTFTADEISQPLKCADRFGTRCNASTAPGGVGIIPRHKLHTVVNWDYGQWGVNVVWNHLDDVTDDNPGVAYIVEKIGAKNYVDLSVDWDATENVSFTAGVRNLTQESYPVLGGNASPSNSGYPATYDVMGRVLFVNASLRY